ncbi:MAG: hypothetical protein JWP81_3423 [Ferruginibacter sp.]|nr:hypothetical protein [Ferruginibacter sp.]
MIIYLTKGNIITPIRELNNTQVQYWKYGQECAYIGGGLMPGTQLIVEEVNKTPGMMWIRAAIPHSDPTKYLKISGEEYALNFKLI